MQIMSAFYWYLLTEIKNKIFFKPKNKTFEKIKYIIHLQKVIAAVSARVVVVNKACLGCNSAET